MSASGVMHMVMNLISNWNRAREVEEQAPIRLAVYAKKWCKPSAGWVKINIDAACPSSSDFVSVGCVVRDDQGGFLRAPKQCN